MRAKAGILFLMLLLLLAGTVSGHLPDNSTITTSNPWVIANGVDQTTITVMVSNLSLGSMSGVNVMFSIDDPIYGSLTTLSTTSDPTGMATSTFKVKTRSGTAYITATMTSHDGEVVKKSVNQYIDHDSPYFPYFSYPLNGEVASEIPFNISITDRWGNRIDDKKEVESGVSLHTLNLHVRGPAPDDCNFVGYGHDISSALDPNGNLSLKVRLTSKIGTNNIHMAPFGSISDRFEWVVAEATGVPYSMTGSISDGGILPVSTKPFIIDYFLYDQYGNAVRNRSIWVNTTLPNEQQIYTSNSLGQIRISYGPKITVNNITINAISVDNHSVTNQLIAHFVNSAPTNMVLAVTPQTMASREVEPTQKAFVRATVIDMLGNPVPGESVKFTISSINTGGFNVSTINGIPSFSSSSVLDNTTATTDSDGNAIVLFYPGAFALRTEPGYNKSANASCTINAQWNSTKRDVIVSWKNYPYLSIEASATPQTIRLNDTFDVNIRVTGDGYAMGGAPVTAILDQDCSASMKNSDSNGLTRLGSSKEAAKAFVDEMKQGQDYVGLISFGTDNNNQFHLAPQADLGLVKTKIISLFQGQQSKMLDESIAEAINNITITQPYRPHDEVRAVIVLNDGNNNIDNQGQMDAFVGLANSANPRIYIFTVVYLDGVPTNDQKKVLTSMNELANRTGGKLFKPTSPEELKQAYIDIAGILQTLAGVNATMQVNYQNVEVNSTPMSGGQAFDYVPVENGETSPDSRTTILWPNITRSFKNQTNEWNANNQLHFDIGTININERWETTYRLKANQTGLIKLFDNTSTISFNNGFDLLEFPDLFITVTPNVTPMGSQTGTLDLANLTVTKSGSITDFIPVSWDLTYSGIATVTETMWYSHNNGPWVLFNSQQNINPGTLIQNGQLDVRKLPPGGYRIKIHAVAPDAVDDEEISYAIMVGSKGVYIKLE
jgi:hypothetical protein